jgi:hypothetical protein
LLKRQRNQDLIGGLALVVKEAPETLVWSSTTSFPGSVAALCTLTDSGPGTASWSWRSRATKSSATRSYASRTAPDDTFAVGERYAKVYSPSVAPQL